MPSRLHTKTIAAGAALTVTTAALIAAPAAADAAGRGVTHVKVTSQSTVSAPATLRPGVVNLRNDGRGLILVFRKKQDNAAKLVSYLGSRKPSVQKKIFTRFGFVEYLMPKANDFVRLAKGTYYLVAAVGAKPKLKGVRAVVVTGRRVDAVRPTYRNIRVNARSVISGATTAGPRPYLRVRNQGSSLELLSSETVKPSVTDAQLREALADKSGEKIDSVIDENADSGLFLIIGGKQDVTTRTSLGRGRYLLAAFGPAMTINAAGPRYFLLTVK